MKKMIVIAALIGGMLMPAQIMAQRNNRNEKPRIENRGGRKEYKNNKGGKKDMNFGKPGKGNRPGRYKYNRPAPPPVVVVNRPAPRPCPPPPPPAPCRYYCNDVVGAAATVVGLAALVALIAD